ncbi:hypothetical protein Y695_04067 [Hydrogenophaga sp. T4]|nr:hypothetical protein Y695_04067 [Hydrogenophaga sp. T4]
MLEDIQRQGGVAKVGEFMEKVKDKNSGVKLMASVTASTRTTIPAPS